MKLKAAVLGASGYGGAELLRLLARHPLVEVACAVAHSYEGREIGELYPHLQQSYPGKRFCGMSTRAEIAQCEVVFSALPHLEGAALLPTLRNRLIIDLSGDFRLQDPALYQQWYQKTHPCPAALPEWTYGLCELNREALCCARRISNPGCYATAIILAAVPLVKERLIRGPLSVVAISGVSGAGRTPTPTVHFAQVAEDLRAYKVCQHQHTPEIEQALGKVAGSNVAVSLVTELGPFTRGILAVVSAELARPEVDGAAVTAAFTTCYGQERFVRLSVSQPGVKEVRGSNLALLCPRVDSRTGRVVVTSAIDNLVKGAAGQAIQNMNLALGWEEDAGLGVVPLYP